MDARYSRIEANIPPAWEQLFRASWDGFKGHFSDILAELKKYQALLEKEGHLANFENVHTMISNLGEKDKEQRRRQLVDTYRWLSAANYRSDHKHLLKLKSGFPGTSEWIFQKKDMISWQDRSSKVSVFWLYGILGSGIC